MRFLIAWSVVAALAWSASAEDKPADPQKPDAKKPDAEKKQPEKKKGTKAPDFTLKNIEGKDVSLKDFKGKIVVIEWVNYNCPFVKKHYDKSGNMPALQKKYIGKGVVWIGICSSNPKHRDYRDEKNLKAAAKERGATYSALLMDADGKIGREYKARTTPHMFIIDKQGYVAYQGAIDSVRSADPADVKGATNYVIQVVDALLAGKKVPVAATQPYG